MVAAGDIERFSRELVENYHPEKVVLFGSFARGEANAGSDVDLLVIMRFEGNGLKQAVKIIRRLKPRFGVDLIVRTPSEIRKRLQQNDFFLKKAVAEGRVLYESADS